MANAGQEGRGVVALARARHVRRVGELEAEGVRGAAADDAVLEEAREAGGVLGEGESINLSVWSDRLGMSRRLLEALVLALVHAPRPAADAPLAAEQVFTFVPAFEGAHFTDVAHWLACFRFLDDEAMARGLAPLGLRGVTGAARRTIALGGVEVDAIVEGLELSLRIEAVDARDATRACVAGAALVGRELLAHRLAFA